MAFGTENTNNCEYVLSRWRDAITDPPPDVWEGIALRHRQHWVLVGRHLLAPGDQWLDITDRPAVAREAVQAAVDLMQAQKERPLVTENRHWNLGRMDGIECGKRSVFRHTGVTPTEVTP